jgi:hypothetical protein
VAPFLVAAAISWGDAMAGLGKPHGSRAATAVFVFTFVGGLVAAAVVASGVRQASRRDLTCGLLAVGVTYAAVIWGHRDGPVSAGLVGLGLLALAYLSHAELQLARHLPTAPTAWTWRVTLAVVGTSVLLDGLVALVAGGGRPLPGHPSTLSVLAGCAVVTAVVTAATALADGAGPPWTGRRKHSREAAAEPPL